MKKFIICDWNRTLYNPETQSLYDDALSFLKNISLYTCVLVSTAEISGSEAVQKTNVGSYFDKIIIGNKSEAEFRSLGILFTDNEVWVVGDRPDLEIYFGNLCGYRTIRLKRGKFGNMGAKNIFERSEFEVAGLLEAANIILSK